MLYAVKGAELVERHAPMAACPYFPDFSLVFRALGISFKVAAVKRMMNHGRRVPA